MYLPFVNYNGQFKHREKVHLGFENRAFRYGDGIFESLRVYHGHLPFLDLHLKRLIRGMQTLQLNLPDYPHDFWEYELKRCLKNLKLLNITKQEHFRIRITVFRASGGLYTPKNNDFEYLIEFAELASAKHELNQQPLTLLPFYDVRLSTDILSELKTTNCLPYILAGQFIQKKGVDDCILFNAFERISETLSSNIFFLKNNTLHTPAITEGGVNGIMRQVILNIAREQNLGVSEGQFTLQDLKASDAVFLTNAIQGIRSVGKIDDQPFNAHEMSFIFTKWLNEKILFKK